MTPRPVVKAMTAESNAMKPLLTAAGTGTVGTVLSLLPQVNAVLTTAILLVTLGSWIVLFLYRVRKNRRHRREEEEED